MASSQPLQRWRTWSAGFAFERGGLLALVALAAYLWIAPTTIVDGDNAEMSTLGALGGRAHPPGYPAYVVYLRLTSWLPGASPAHTAAIATSVLAAVLVLVLHAACRAWGARPGAATLACAIYAASPIVLRMHAEAEVFALNGLVVATVLWLAAAAGPLRGAARGFALGVAAGLGLANHLTCALVAPVGILGVARAIRERRAAIPFALLGLAVGLSPYAYLAITSGPTSYGSVDDLGDLMAFVLREDYGGPAAFAPNDDPALPGANLAVLAETLGRAWLWLPGVLGLAMLGIRIARPGGETRAGWSTLAASFLVAGPLLVTRFNIEPTEIGRYLVTRFHLLPVVLLAIPVAAGFDVLAQRIDRGAGWLARGRARAPLVIVAAFALLVVAALPRLAAQHSPAFERQLADTLRSLPPHAVAVVFGDDFCFGLPYLQHARGERPDVEVVCWAWLPRPWYRAGLERRGIPIANPTFAADVDRILARRPVFYSLPLGAAFARRPSYAYGVLFRVLPHGERPPPIAEVFDQNRALFASFDLDYPQPGPDDEWPAAMHKRYAAMWVTLARELLATGDRERAREALEIARALYPYVFKDIEPTPP